MPYIINRYDGTELTVLEDGSINTTTSLGLIGRNYFGYGEQQNENFVFLLENFANVNPPARPLKGQTWFDTSENLLKIYDGNLWIVVGSASVSDTAPTSATVGSLWLKTPSDILYVYNGSEWSFIGPETAEGFGTTKCESSVLLDSENIERPIILFKVDDIVIAIASSVSFTINSNLSIPGFSTIGSGITLSSSFRFRGNLQGTADRALQLQTTRLINGVGFDGSSNITIKATTNNKLVPGQYIIGDQFDGSSPTLWSVDATALNQPNQIVARNPSGDFSARRITADFFIGDLQGNVNSSSGTSFFNVVSANSFVGATLTGNAETATRLRNPRRINGVLFSGTEDIIVSANAQTLTGTFINSQVVSSNLTQLGTLENLSIKNSGISIGDSLQKLKITYSNAGPLIYSETGILRIGSNPNPEFSFLNSAETESQGGDPGNSSLVPIGNSIIGLPSRKIKKIYVEQVVGKSDESILSDSANNLTGGSTGSLVYQSSAGKTSFLPAGTAGYVLKATAGNSVQWAPLSNERLNKGNHIIFKNSIDEDVNFYNLENQATISVDATSQNVGGKIVLRDPNGDFSAGVITADLIGNSSSATKLQIPRNINGVPFDGTQDISILVNYTITYGNTIYSISGYTNQVGSFNDGANYFDVFPPAGKSMSNLIGFVPSIAMIHYSGNVDGNDSLRCVWEKLSDRVRVWVQNTEQRSTPAGNYLAIWS